MRLLVSHQPPASHFFNHIRTHYFITYTGLQKWCRLLCVTVVDKNSRKTLLSWETVESHSETTLLDNYSYTCSSSLQNIKLSSRTIQGVYIRNISCYEPIEKLYYSAGYDPICIYYAEEVTVATRCKCRILSTM